MFDEVDKNNAYTEGESEEADQKGIHLHLGAIQHSYDKKSYLDTSAGTITIMGERED